jgi:HEAT repeat protein
VTSQIDEELEMLLIGDTLLVDRDEFFGRIEAMAGAGAHIRDGLRRSMDAENWWLAGRYVLAAFSQPSRDMTPVLCTLLRLRSRWLNNADIVDVLAEIGDPAAVGCLAGALRWEPADTDLAIRCVRALGAIGTARAVAVLTEAASAASDDLRLAAAAELSHLGLSLGRPRR